ncbi:hypothetical protein [Rhodovulum sp. BSW8]|uniref:hypothetical protein n=1 Tax=Rhodovulum sp. BSW8 TaxID=2259645 RepID=UPI00140271FB|nr:hypothetical protein [Rhodovulum sp. BSW8]
MVWWMAFLIWIGGFEEVYGGARAQGDSWLASVIAAAGWPYLLGQWIAMNMLEDREDG